MQVTPPGQFRPQFPRTAAQRLQEPTAPTSDGLGQLADGDEDFGEIHARWARMYFESSLHYPNEWLSLVFAAALLAIYFHSSGLLVETWSWVGQASRLAMPLGLNTGGLVGKGPTLVTPRASSSPVVPALARWRGAEADLSSRLLFLLQPRTRSTAIRGSTCSGWSSPWTRSPRPARAGRARSRCPTSSVRAFPPNPCAAAFADHQH